MTQNIRILIADDHPMVRSALKQAIVGGDGEAFDVIEAASLASVGGPIVDSLNREFVARIADLTPRQRRVFGMVAHGKSNKEIAFEMNISEGTVKAHVSQILTKLGVHSRTEAALVAGRFNGVTLGPETRFALYIGQ